MPSSPIDESLTAAATPRWHPSLLWVHLQPDRANRLRAATFEFGVSGELECLSPPWLHVPFPPDPGHGCERDAQLAGEQAGGAVGHAQRFWPAGLRPRTAASSMTGGRPDRSRSPSALNPPVEYRSRHWITVGRDTPIRRAISVFGKRRRPATRSSPAAPTPPPPRLVDGSARPVGPTSAAQSGWRYSWW